MVPPTYSVGLGFRAQSIVFPLTPWLLVDASRQYCGCGFPFVLLFCRRIHGPRPLVQYRNVGFRAQSIIIFPSPFGYSSRRLVGIVVVAVVFRLGCCFRDGFRRLGTSSFRPRALWSAISLSRRLGFFFFFVLEEKNEESVVGWRFLDGSLTGREENIVAGGHGLACGDRCRGDRVE